MSFDIYGNNLRRGHCEVHPHVHEEYPCSVCIRESGDRREHQSQQDREYDEYCRQMEADHDRFYQEEILAHSAYAGA